MHTRHLVRKYVQGITPEKKAQVSIWPFIPYFNMHIFYTIQYTFPTTLMGRTSSQSRLPLAGDHFFYSHDLNV